MDGAGGRASLSEEAQGGDMAHILVIEDNALNRELTRRQLELAGYTVVEAADGAAGLRAVWTAHPDLIVLDLSMPLFDGWTLARQLKAAAETRAIPIIAVTAHALSGDRAKALAAGCDEYEAKPVDFPRLLTKMQALLARR